MLGPPDSESPDRGFKITAMLADYAAATPDGKLTVVGAGWTMNSASQPGPFSIAMLVEVPWNLTNQRHTVRMELIDLDGVPVTPIGDEEPKWIEAQFEIGRPPGVRPGAMLPVPLALNHGPMPIEPGHYEWRWTIDGQAHADWRLAFSAMPDAQARAA